jgi:hypothetical protein
MESIQLNGKLPSGLPASQSTVIQPEEPEPDLSYSEIMGSRQSDYVSFDEGPTVNYGENEITSQLNPSLEAGEATSLRRELMRKLFRYRVTFKDELTDLDLEDLGSKSYEELKTLLDDTEFMVSTRRSMGASRQMFLAGTVMMEQIGPYLGAELKGLTNVCANNPDLLTTVDEVAIKYEKQLVLDPVARLGILMGQLVLAVHTHNTRNGVSPAAQAPNEEPGDKPAENSEQGTGCNPGKRADLLNKINET